MGRSDRFGFGAWTSPWGACVASVLLAACGGEVALPNGAPVAVEPASKLSDVVKHGLESGVPQEALLVLDGEAIEVRARDEQGLPEAPTDRALREERRRFREVVFRDAKRALEDVVAPGEVELLEDFDQLPVRFVRVGSLDAALALAASPDVVQLHENLAHEAFGTENLTIINQPAALQSGFAGTGATVAVLDTGLDYTRPDFGCTGLGEAGCKVAFATDFAPEDGALDDPAKLHGTAVAATIAAVAPGARLVGLDVFSGAYAYDVDLVEALNWVVANRETYAIEAVNMSLGGGKYLKECPGLATTEAIKAARDVGVLAAVASGNNGYIDGIAYPSCGPAAISVGATTASAMTLNGTAVAADTVTYYSNSSAQLVMLAPGSQIDAIGYGWHGTSFAAPHVAAAIATLAAAYPDDTPALLRSRLTTAGKSVLDTRNKRSFPRLDLSAASQACVPAVTPTSITLTPSAETASFQLTVSQDCAWTATSSAGWATVSAASGSGSTTLTVSATQNTTTASRQAQVTFAGKTLTIVQNKDATPPTGTVSIQGGSAGFVGTPSVTLAISGSDLNGVGQMCVSNGTTCSAWEAFATSKAWTLSAGDGTKTVRVWLKDGVGNTTTTVPSATIKLDTTGPTGGSVKAATQDQALALSWSGITDALSGVASYKVVSATGTTAPANCLAGTTVYEGTALTTTHTGLVNGTIYSYRVCGIDKLGKMGAGVVTSGKPVPFTAPPVGSLSIAGGAAYTTTQAVTLTIGATSQGTVTEMCLSNATTCSTWEAFATSKAWTLTATNGTKTVRLWLRDEWGNTTTTAVSDSIVWDSLGPAGGTLKAAQQNEALALSWSGVTDSVSGVASYKVVYAVGTTAPANCLAGTTVYEGTALTTTHSGLTNGTVYSYRVCGIDKVGNLGAGVVASGKPVPFTAAPVGTVSIDAGASYTKTQAVTLTISATSQGSTLQMCVSNATTCTTWIPFAATYAWTLSTGNGTKTVRVWLRDEWGNTTATPPSDTIVWDNVAPALGGLTTVVSAGQVKVSWSGITDSVSGVASYTLRYDQATSTPTCSSGTVLYTGTAASFTHTGLSPATAYGYRVCAEDKAGNASTGAGKVVTTPL